jgi:4-hydroxybenzoate polyprenyltransferase
MSALPLRLNVNALLALCRASNLPTVWMNVVTAAVLSDVHGSSPAMLVLLLAFSLSCFYCAGMALNDLCDVEHDSMHQRYRPIPAGRISVSDARHVTLALFAFALASLLSAPHRVGFVAGVGLLTLIWIYDRFHKRQPATVFAMAGARLLVYVVTGLALAGELSLGLWLAAGLQSAYVLLLTVVARLEGHRAGGRYPWPVIPWMLRAMPLLDAAVLAILVDPAWICAGVAGAMLTYLGQRYVRGD